MSCSHFIPPRKGIKEEMPFNCLLVRGIFAAGQLEAGHYFRFWDAAGARETKSRALGGSQAVDPNLEKVTAHGGGEVTAHGGGLWRKTQQGRDRARGRLPGRRQLSKC